MLRAARRNLEAADHLYRNIHRRGVAGYLYGIAAECAVKHMLISIQLPQQHDKKNMLFMHFPELRTRLRDCLAGRRAQTLLSIVNDSFMQNWHVSMRYADGQQINPTWVENWRQQTRRIVNEMNM